ncbi:hypothetical protein AGMMS50230_10900 [Spirochaetia bacterium]|nr:hypothetical protein AGMMS50230_10900 [Spirochaetia bacterium]
MADNELFELDQPKPIRGYPTLQWAGKRPFESTQYFPAQCKESYGKAKDGWLNKIYWGDNLQVMSHLMKEYRGKIDLIYIDPPFDSKADYKKKIELKGQKITNDNNSFEEKQYGDIWTNDEYLQFIYQRLVLMKELLSDTGSLYLHCDWRVNSFIRIILDEIFGSNNFINEVVWCYSIGGKGDRFFGRKHDTIFWYGKKASYFFNGYDPLVVTSRKVNTHMRTKNDSNGREYQEKTDKKTGKIYKYYVDEGKIPEDYWTDIEQLNREDGERCGYPTQKPEAILNRIIASSTPPGGIVFDCFMGSGTTQAVAMKLGRRFIGADINLGAVQTTTKRLVGIAKELSQELGNDKYTGFEVYNVNNYEFFRNPIEAKDILLEALEIEKASSTSLYDGEKDGRMVKIMPVDRICCRADFEGFLHSLPYKTFQQHLEKEPNKPAEKITIVCMGHEPDLKAVLEKELKQYNIDIEITDILRDKKDLELKRDSEADITINKGKLIIKKFYPMNLMQKLSLDKHTVSADWRELVESVMVDFNYDGVVLQPGITDIPDKKELVKGEYPIPTDAGIIRVKITDLLSESLEVEVTNG